MVTWDLRGFGKEANREKGIHGDAERRVLFELLCGNEHVYQQELLQEFSKEQ